MRPLLVIAAFLLLTGSARAGSYEHHATVDGWSPAVAGHGFVAAEASSGELSLRFWARAWFSPGEVADWVYTAPPDTSIAAWRLERAVTGIEGGDWNTLFAAVVDGRWRLVAWDVPSELRPWEVLAGSADGASAFVARLVCGGPGACLAAGTAALTMRGARFVLRDDHAPEVRSVRGDLADERVLTGTAALSFAAADRGGGLYRAVAEVDGRPLVPVPLGDGLCRDVVPGGDPYEFAARRPCPLEGGATVSLDTTALAEGRHVVAVYVEDAAGNRTAVLGPVARTVDNVPEPPPPSPSSPAPAAPSIVTPTPVIDAWLEHRGRRHRAVTVDHGVRVRLRGRVTDRAGRPLAGAPVDITELVPGRRGTPITGIRSRADGRFTTFTRVGPSRRLRIAAGPKLTVHVRAPVTVRVSGALVRGRLLGGHVPRRGALVEIQTKAPRWATRLVVRTFRSGRYVARLVPPAPAVRVRVPRQAGLPYAAGLARPVSPPRRGGRTGPRTSR